MPFRGEVVLGGGAPCSRKPGQRTPVNETSCTMNEWMGKEYLFLFNEEYYHRISVEYFDLLIISKSV